MLARLVIAVSPSFLEPEPDSFEPQPEHPARVALVDLRLVLVGGPHARHGLDRVADEPRPFSGSKGMSVPKRTGSAPKHANPDSIPSHAVETRLAVFGADHARFR